MRHFGGYCARTLLLGQRIELLQQLAAPVIVHRTPVVRVDQAQVPQLGALIEVRHSRDW